MPRRKGFCFPREIIAHAVWNYYRFGPSTADVEDLLAERGVIVSRETVRKWVNQDCQLICTWLNAAGTVALIFAV
tara:strand:- start:2499 stop:2723 length:225 start_codon:yes stop_codon:yes gene_type:complete